MSALPVTVIADDRDPEYIANQLSSYSLAVTRGRLQAGDYCFFPHQLTVLIERKTIPDLLGSLSDNRMVDQAHKLIASANTAILLREGELRRDISQVSYRDPKHPEADKDGWVRTGWSWDSFQGMMLDIQLMGILIYDAVPMGSAAYEIARIVQSLSKDEHKWIRQRQRPDIVTIDPQYRDPVWSLCAFSGVGPETAEGILRAYRTWAKASEAIAYKPEEVAEVRVNGRRIGKLATKLSAAAHKDWGL